MHGKTTKKSVLSAGTCSAVDDEGREAKRVSAGAVLYCLPEREGGAGTSVFCVSKVAAEEGEKPGGLLWVMCLSVFRCVLIRRGFQVV